MSTKARFPVQLRRARRSWRKFALEVTARAMGAASTLSRAIVWNGTPASTRADVPELPRRPVPPPRERGTCRAFALAVAMHVVLAAFLFSGAHWQKNTPAGTTVAVADRSTLAPSWLPVPSVTEEPMRPAARDENAHINVASQSEMHRYRQTVRQAQPAKRPRQAPAVRTLVGKAGEKAAQKADSSADRQHEERLAALLALAADVSSGNDLKPDTVATASPGYADRVRRRVRPNVVAPTDINGNLSSVIAVRCAPDGSLLSATMQRSSGNLEWDIAALSAVEKSNPMPRDVNGSTPSSFLITFRPKG
ncbi:cell envelope integrity protein TolA [Paraburkholderia sp. MM5482-R1]|uniref:cell envelope integrity protein TolA n=2 Tax=Paraburkholderia TaxID=1822464 RepID=UPI003D1BA6EF